MREAALERGLPHLAHHVKNVQQFGVPVVVALNRILSDTDAELKMVEDYASKIGVKVILTEVWAKGGEGGEALAHEVLALLAAKTGQYAPLYSVDLPIKEKIETIVKKVYGGDGVYYAPSAERSIEYLTSIGMGNTPVCIAKTQYSLTDDPTRLCKPTGFRITINEVTGSAGAGFVVAKAGDIMTMPGLPKVPAAEGMSIDADGEISGLS
jgi:formate--tetrahydrofolate ligase